VALDKLGEGLQLLGDELARGLVFECAGLVIQFCSAAADEDFRFVQGQGIQEHHHAAQIVLDAAAAERAGEADWIAIGLPAKGWFDRRETQSMAFLRPPGREKLYSGVQKMTPSAARIASARTLTGAGKPDAFWGRRYRAETR
jgi:hypothetical protein